MTCKHYKDCCYYCGNSNCCDYFLETGRRRPDKPFECPGYHREKERNLSGVLLPNSLLFERKTGAVLGKVQM